MAKGLFDIPSRPSKESDMALARKSIKKSSAPKKSGGGLLDKIARARSMLTSLGDVVNEYESVTEPEALHDYIDACIIEGVVAIDTETTGLNPLVDDIVGFSLSTIGQKTVYVPLKHVSYIDYSPLGGQMPMDVAREELARLNNIYIIMFNATFDLRVIKNQVGVRLHCNWDCFLAARLMNENEESNALKKLHHKYCGDPTKEAYKFSDLFDGVCFNLVPLSIAYAYAANDAKITLELYQFQKKYLYYDSACDLSDRNGMNGVAWVFFNLEMPCVDVVVDMEDAGVKFDFEFNQKLKDKYHSILNEREKAFHTVCVEYGLSSDINIGSVQQLQTALYDQLGLVATDNIGQPTRSTDKKSLMSIEPKHPVVDAILDYREFSTMVSTFIDKLPEVVNPNDGRVHCRFNQCGADTGRFSSDKPNMQNIPHNEIRKMFTASDGCVLLSSDYSQQEPSCLAAFCNEMGYPTLYEARKSGDDIYSHVASACFNVPYEQCCEFDKDGHKNPPEYKKRRNLVKPVLLGILYGRGDDSVAKGMGITLEEAKRLKANLYKKYPEIKIFEQASIEMAEDLGYVTTVCGRKRRLPSMMLPDYEVKWKDGASHDDDPLSFDSEVSTEVPEDIQRRWLTKLSRTKYKRGVFEAANEEGLWIIDHTKEKDFTKIVNARIQGSAADLTKLAMILVTKDEKLKELGFKLLIPVHDELIGECPEENAKECARRLAEVMSEAAERILKMPFSCDVEVSKEWYGDSIEL